MKKYTFHAFKRYLSLAVMMMFFITSCRDEDLALKETPMDFLSPETAYSSLEGFTQGIAGLHLTVRTRWYDDGAHQAQFVTNVNCLGTDVAYYGENPGSTSYFCNYETQMVPEFEIWAHFWNSGYELIQRANVLIEKIETSNDDIWFNEAQKKAYMAEARFFRAWAYNFLVPLWGDVPLIKEVISSAKADFVRAPKADVYQLIEDDLIFGTVNLPDRGEEESPGRITKGAAWHYLTDTHLQQSEWQQAVNAASEIIDGGRYALMTERFGSTIEVFGTGDVFLDLFARDNHNLPENREGIWVLQFEPFVTGGGSFGGERAFGCAYFRVGNTPDGFTAFRGVFYDGKYTGYCDTLGRPVAHMRPTNYAAYDIWRSDWNNDIRNAPHTIKRNFYFDNPASQYHKMKIDFSLYPPGTRDKLRDTTQNIYPYCMKFADPLNRVTEPVRSGGGRNHKDYYECRLAETILFRAEAYFRLGLTDLAANDINQIRNRANATPVSSADVDLDFILDERVRELYGEEFRHITLRRTGTLLERVRKYQNNPVYPTMNIKDHHVLWPIPQAQIDLNIDVEFPQNPGY